jgi:hypothetical protein
LISALAASAFSLNRSFISLFKFVYIDIDRCNLIFCESAKVNQ